MSSNSSASGDGIGFFGLLTILFIALKLTGQIDWSWLWVLAPLWGPVVVVILVGVAYVIGATAPAAIRRARCKHERFYETRACDAVCSACGKNLGFIGAVRERRAALR